MHEEYTYIQIVSFFAKKGSWTICEGLTNIYKDVLFGVLSIFM